MFPRLSRFERAGVNVPVAPNQGTPITNAGKGTNHQPVKATKIPNI